MASWITDSLTARPPDSELTAPTFTLGPEVSTQSRAAAVSVSPARLPHPAASIVVAASSATPTRSLVMRSRLRGSGIVGAQRRNGARCWALWEESPNWRDRFRRCLSAETSAETWPADDGDTERGTTAKEECDGRDLR